MLLASEISFSPKAKLFKEWVTTSRWVRGRLIWTIFQHYVVKRCPKTTRKNKVCSLKQEKLSVSLLFSVCLHCFPSVFPSWMHSWSSTFQLCSIKAKVLVLGLLIASSANKKKWMHTNLKANSRDCQNCRNTLGAKWMMWSLKSLTDLYWAC